MNNKKHRNWPLSHISTLHYLKLVFRSALFLAAVGVYIHSRITASGGLTDVFAEQTPFLMAIWLVYAVEMVLRFFPSRLESMGCEKQFPRHFSPTARAEVPAAERRRHTKSALTVAAVWIVFNAAIGALYLTCVIDRGILLLISLAFSVCDMICILFFCPFQTLMMKNKCCVSCRIYNWDYAMMFTPLLLVRSAYTWSLLAISLALLLRWEITCRRHPERFSEATNHSLSCSRCREKLCSHKKSLRRFLRRQRSSARREADKLYE